MSAAFSSRSAQHQTVNIPDSGVPVGQYDAHAIPSMAAQAAKTNSRKPQGSFGASARELDWGRNGTDRSSAREVDAGPRSDETASVRSTFSSARGSKGPSAAMGGGSRFGPTKEANSGDYYVPPALGTSKSYNGNRRSSFLGTMGSSKRFTEVKVAAGGDYADARPGAFASASKKGSNRSNTGFGGVSSRVSTFGEAAKRAEESSSAHLSYDTSKHTSAFAKASEHTNKSSAAFASKSSQRTSVSVPEGPGAQQYNTASVGSLAEGANKSFNKSLQRGAGGFGTSARRTSGVMPGSRPTDVPGPGEYAPDISDAAESARSARPSSAFASTTRKDVVRQTAAPTGADYDAHASDGMAAQVTKTFNKKAGTGSMGTSSRFAPAKECAPGDYSDARPGAFSSSSTKSKSNTGFGGTTPRVSAFGEAAKRAEDSSSAHLSYDTSKHTSAFAKASEHTNKSSAAFASKSSQRTSVSVPEGPGAQQYNTASVGSLAESANKSFNKSLQNGSGGFGTSARRTSGVMPGSRPTDVPGPGEYAPDISDAEPRSARPSSAFASTTRKDVVRTSAAPTGADYDAHASDGMAAQVTKTFNKKAGTGGFGSRAPRQIHDTKETPGPGEYQMSDPHRPTVDSGLHATKGKGTGAFASTTLRDSTQWNTTGRDSGFSSFLP